MRFGGDLRAKVRSRLADRVDKGGRPRRVHWFGHWAPPPYKIHARCESSPVAFEHIKFGILIESESLRYVLVSDMPTVDPTIFR
jgi:hypothetical protein